MPVKDENQTTICLITMNIFLQLYKEGTISKEEYLTSEEEVTKKTRINPLNVYGLNKKV